MAQQTAVEWLAIRYHHRQGYLSQEDIEQAKKMEKEQILDAYIEGINEPYLEVTDDRHLFVKPNDIFNSAEQYFKETYGKEMQ